MYKLKRFDQWNKNVAKFGSGASEKIWLTNPKNNNIGIFKYPKIRNDNTITGEFWAEKLAADIGKLLGIKCAKVDIGTYYRKKRFDELQFYKKRRNIFRGSTNNTRKIFLL